MAHRQPPPYDPVLLHARRESISILLVFCLCLVWAIGWYLAAGYWPDGAAAREPVATTLGVPNWVFWGVFAPWGAVNLFTVWFCFCYMADDALGPDDEAACDELSAGQPEGGGP
jgi:hypothetical protein